MFVCVGGVGEETDTVDISKGTHVQYMFTTKTAAS